MSAQFKVERRMLSHYGWRWCVTQGGQIVCHSNMFTRAHNLRQGLTDYQPVGAKPLTQADIEGRPPEFIPQGNVRQLLWNAGKDNQQVA
jgi:hypothetical protein